MSILRFCAFGVLLLGAGRLDAAGKELKAGVARVEVTPPVGSPMGGYGDRQGPSTGVHDPLYATVLVLKSAGIKSAGMKSPGMKITGEKSPGITVAIISCDLRPSPMNESSHWPENASWPITS